MNANRQILILHSTQDEAVAIKQLAESIARLGSTAVVRSMHDGQYDRVLDAVELADTVLYWPPDRAMA